MGWVAYVLAWLAAAVFWTLAAASGAGRSPFEALPFAVLAMGSAAVMGVAVWRLTNRVAWDWSAKSFYATHAAAVVVYSVFYAISWIWPDVVRGRFGAALLALRTSPIFTWNLLMGTWLYLMVAGISYAIRANHQARTQAAAAADARLLAQQAQLAALRARINPHFLFNALHSVGALVTCDPARADTALERLGDLLRYTLGTEDEVLFAQEWTFTQDYLAFEQLRLGDRLRVHVAVDSSALSIMVPPLILQPLVENAVRHGIADRAEGGQIDLTARVEGSRLLLCVRDDGQDGESGGPDGIGLTSVRRRLAALYGGRATLVIDGGPAGFAVTVGLPLAPRNDLDSAA